jgi:leucyl aminopeptidase
LEKDNGNVVSLEIIRGEELLARGLNLIHAVGRGYKEVPVLVDMFYKGD